jgi:DNA-binding CsgD family transcriptional regulator
MGASHQLRASDVAAIHQLVGECRDLGADAEAWQRHLINEVRRRLGCQMGGVVETVPTLDGMKSDFATHREIGLTDREKQLAIELLTSGEFPQDMFCLRLSRTFTRGRPTQLTRQRQDLIGDSEWFRCETFESHRLTGASDIVMSLLQIQGTDRAFCMGFTRGIGERALNGREAQVVGLIGQLLQPHLGRGLALAGEPGIATLSSRRRQVLAGLLDGLTEKEIARELTLSVPTVHEYVMGIYRHFRIGSRAELLAQFLRRQQGPAREWIERFRTDGGLR